MRLPYLFAVAVLLPALCVAHEPAQHTPALKIEGPADAYVYELAAPGTYDLPRIKPAADGHLLDESGAEVRLGDLLNGRLTILSFMYTRCGDVCPLAAVRLHDLQGMAAGDAAIAEQLQIISLSFDPAHDTPDVMSDYGALMRRTDVAVPPWRFLTAAGQAEITPLLEAYNQPVARKTDPNDPSGPLAHLLRVFLIDPKSSIRNIYSADFLDPRLLMNDLRTLQMEAP